MDTAVVLIVVGGITVAVFLLLRQFWCWYWKINERNKLLTSINEKLDRLLGTSAATEKVTETKHSEPAKRSSYYDDNEPVNMDKIVPK